jgi:hypothetical protein
MWCENGFQRHHDRASYDPIGNIRNDGGEPRPSSRIISLSGYDAPKMTMVEYFVCGCRQKITGIDDAH